MNKFTIVVAVALVATSAFASKARLGALQNSVHLEDTRDVVSSRPDQALAHGEFAAMELSANATGANDTTPNAEGGFVRKMGENSALGAWIGNKSNLATTSLALVGSTPKLQNPLNLYYASKMGEMMWGLGLNYSAAEDKFAKSKSTSMGLTASVSSNAGWDAQLGLGLTGEATQADTTKYEQKSPVSLGGRYTMDTMYFYGSYAMYGGKSKNISAGTTNSEVDNNDLKIGVINSHKKDGADFFYGVSYMSSTSKIKDGAKTETTAFPVIIGVEADATSWLVLRASVTQNVLMASNKVTPASGTATTDSSMYDNTVTAAGLGLKLGKFMVDGSLAATSGNSGKFGTNDAGFLSNVGMTYMF